MKFKGVFHVISYFQYPLMALSFFYSIKPYFSGIEYMASHIDELFKSYNDVLIFAGLGISFSTLQDTTKTQNNFSKKIWENPKKGKVMIFIMIFLTSIILGTGVYGYFISDNQIIKEVSFGMIVMGIGLVGFLKTGLEVFENHRKDKNTTPK